MIWLKLAWRNIFRNTRRTLLSSLVVGIGLGAMMMVDALVHGISAGMIQLATENLLGHGQIHSRAYREEPSVDHYLKDIERVQRILDASPGVTAYAPRAKAPAMVSSARGVSAVLLTGIVPDKERGIISLPRHVIQGEFLTSPDTILIGQALAEYLEVGLGDRIVVTLGQADTGDLSQELFRVGGIFAYGSQGMDRGLAFVTLPKAKKLMGIDSVHEVAVRLSSVPDAPDHPLWKSLSTERTIAEGWQDLVPELSSALKMSEWSVSIMALILFGVIALGVVNTMFMSLHERMFEFAVIRAVGTRASRVSWMILFEAASLGVLSCAVGLILGAVAIFSLASIGIHYGGLEIAEVAMTNRIYPHPRWQQFVLFPPVIVLLTVVAAVYPAWVASRLVPAEAMRKSL